VCLRCREAGEARCDYYATGPGWDASRIRGWRWRLASLSFCQLLPLSVPCVRSSGSGRPPGSPFSLCSRRRTKQTKICILPPVGQASLHWLTFRMSLSTPYRLVVGAVDEQLTYAPSRESPPILNGLRQHSVYAPDSCWCTRKSLCKSVVREHFSGVYNTSSD
jgi:hypothetical protein